MINRSTLFFPLALLGVTAISGAVLASSTVSADNDTVVDQINITVPVSCTMSGTGMTSHTAEIANGTYEDDIGTTTLKAFCNDNNGFAIYATGYTGNEIGATNSNKLVGTPASIGNIDTGIATSGNTSNWAMKLETDGTATYAITLDNGFGSYKAVPNEYTKVAHRDSGTDIGINATGASLTTTYAAYMSSTQGAGTYSGQVIYTLVHPASEAPLQPQTPTQGCINYFANASNAVGTMGCQSVSSDGASIDLLASNFSREGYGFAGWSDAYDYATNEDAHFYGPQETITVPTGTKANGLSLYAVWIKSAGNLQDTNKVTALCGTGGTGGSLTPAPATGANLSSVSALTDQRDGQTYAIAKLADNNCWMIENLRLEHESTVGNNQIDPSVTNESLSQGYGKSTTYGNFSGLANPESTNFSDSTTANSIYYSGTQSGDATINIGTSDYPGYRMPRYNNTNTSARASNPANNSGAMYSYGNYYTWHAAIADITYYSSGDHGTTSLCPTGWRLPIGNQSTTSKSFGALSVALGGPEGGATANSSSNPTGAVMSGVFRSYPNNLLYSGYFSTSSAYSRGSYGYYWSSTARSILNSYHLNLNSSYVYPGTGSYNKHFGLSVRCLAGS
ncbi:MAG: FISUMP domain-containing protein [Candidatus Saccharibacteria bacterium]|nr:FISUMP domain-containing protein [Candidatus Saccharibacteria bacterium]